MSLSFLREITLMWHESLSRAAHHPFRETVSGRGDVSMLFLLSHFVVERWREALLWSWTIAKHGSLSGEWSEATMREAWAELGGEDDVKELEVRAGWRESIEDRRMKSYLKASGHVQSDKTQYRFSEYPRRPVWLSSP